MGNASFHGNCKEFLDDFQRPTQRFQPVLRPDLGFEHGRSDEHPRAALPEGLHERAVVEFSDYAKKLIPDPPSRWLYARTLTEGGIGASAMTRSSRWPASSARRLSSFHSRHTMRTLDGHLDWRKLEEACERDEDAACAFAPCASPPPRGLTQRERPYS